MTHKERIETMSEEQKSAYDEKKKEAAARLKERKAAAKAKVKDWIATEPRGLDDETKMAILYLIGSAKVSRAGVNDELKQMFIDNGTVTAMELFQKFELGKPAMDQKIRAFIKVADPNSRIWIARNDNGDYELKGTGEKPPKGWTGYVPAESVEL